MKRRTKDEKAREAKVHLAFALASPGNPINVLDISKVFKEGHRLLDAGATDDNLRAGVRAFVENLAKETA